MSSPTKYWSSLSFALALLALVAILSLNTGPVSSDPQFSLYQIKLPRFLTAALLGASLAFAGSLLQLATRNPLSEPELLGINQSAVFAVVLLLLIGGNDTTSFQILLAAFLGGAASGTAVLTMTASGSFPRERLILAGLTLAFFFGSASSGLLLLRETDLFELLHWTAGKISGADWRDVGLATLALGVCLILSLGRVSQWNALQLGDSNARSLGIEPVHRKTEIIAISVLLCATCVAIAGPIGFVGIVVPHLSQIFSGLDYRRSLPLTIILGSLLVSAADLLARTVLYPVEIPVGILTALIGAPYFLYRAQKL